jgi:arginyl-tRNA synthetase
MATAGAELPEILPGPAEVHLGRVLAAELGQPQTPLHVETAQNRALGDFKVLSSDPTREGCRAFADRLAAVPLIDTAVAVPPNVYIRPVLATLQRAVVPAVVEAGSLYGATTIGGYRPVQVQFSCPNFNKSLHLGHLRTNVVGMALANAFAELGYRVIRTDQPSNWGRHIAKVCVAATWVGWPPTGAGAGTRPDRTVGELYNRCNRALEDPATADETARQVAEMMARLDAGDEEAVALNDAITEACASGIRQTYDRIGTRFDATLQEGDTVFIAKALIEANLGGQCTRRDDGSIFIDLTDAGLRPVNLLRKEGDPLLHAFFLGASTRRHELLPGSPFLFLMGREYAPTVPELQEVVRRLSSPDMADNIEGVFHGMVSRGTKKMSSRADAVELDQLLDDVAARFLKDWQAASDVPVDPYHRDVADRLAVALVKYHFLRPPRMKDVPWDEADLWDNALPRLARVIHALTVEPQQAVEAPTTGKAADDLRSLLLALNRFPDAVRETVIRRDPSHLVRFVDEVCERTESVARRGHLDRDLADAVRLAVRRALRVLNVDLPPFLAALPPTVLSAADPPPR